MPRARISYGILTSQDQGGGDKKQGLPPTVGKSIFNFHLIKRKAWPTEKDDDTDDYIHFVILSLTGTNEVFTSTNGITWSSPRHWFILMVGFPLLMAEVFLLQ